MINRIRHETEDSEKLSATVIIYWFSDKGLVLDQFITMKRDTRRHKYKNIKIWNRLDHRDSNIEKPKISETIKAEILEEARSKINFTDGE